MPQARNRGCLACKDRKIKCDERWPVCANCEKKGRQCPGPMQTAVFVVHKMPIPPSPPRKNTRSCPPRKLVWEIPKNRQSSARVGVPWLQQQEPPSSPGHVTSTTAQGTRRGQGQEDSSLALGELVSPLSLLPLSESQCLSGKLVSTLESTEHTGFTLRICGEHIEGLPSRIGHCKALDASISYLLSVLAGLRNPERVDSCPYQHRAYGRALHHLKHALEAPRDQDVEALVAATIILGDAELFNNHTQGFLTHSGGSEAVMKGWGPKKMTSKFSRVLFVTLASGVIASSMLSSRRCFLDAPDWTTVFQSALRDSEGDPRRHIWIQVWQIYARLPSIVQCMKSSSGDLSFSEIRAMVLDLWAQLTSVEVEADILLRNRDLTIELPSQLEQSSLPTYYHFPNVQTAETMCHFWKLTMVVAQLMKTYGLGEYAYTYTHDQPDVAAATNICRTIEFAMRTKPLGAWYMPLVLPLAAHTLSNSKHLQQYAVWAYNDIVDAGLAVGLDMGAHGEYLKPATEGIQPQYAGLYDHLRSVHRDRPS